MFISQTCMRATSLFTRTNIVDIAWQSGPSGTTLAHKSVTFRPKKGGGTGRLTWMKWDTRPVTVLASPREGLLRPCSAVKGRKVWQNTCSGHGRGGHEVVQ